MSAYTETTKYVASLDGTRIFCSALGDPSLPAVIFVHGQSISSIAWDVIFEDQTWLQHVYLVRYDVRGHGRSDKPEAEEAYGEKKLADDFDAVVEGSAARDVFFAGWSAGAALLADIVIHSKTRLRGAILISGVPYLGVIPVVATPPVLELLFKGLLITDDVALSHSTMFNLLDWMVHKPENMPYRLRATWFGDGAAQPPSVRKTYLLRKQDAQPFLDLKENMCEVLVLHGEEDLQVDKEKTWEIMNDAFAGRVQKCWIKDAGHAPFLEQPEKCKAIIGFVQRVVRQKE